MNPISHPSTTSLNSRELHERLGHACDKMLISSLKQHLPLFDHKSWQPFYCGTCAVTKSAHRLARARTKIPKESLLELLVSDVMGPFATDPQVFHYLVTVWDHASTYSVFYPLKARSDAPEAILDAIKQLQVRMWLTRKALQMDNAWEFTSSSFTLSLAKLGVSFYPSLPYSPQKNGEDERLNRMLVDMAQSMILDSRMQDHFWRPVEETVFVEPPLQFWPHLKGKELRLKKALYRMKEAGQRWWIFLSDILTQMGFTAMEVDQSLYIFRSGETTVAIWIHVDDGVVTSNSQAAISNFKQRLCAEVEIKWHDTITQIVGLECAIGEGEVTIAQQRLTNSVIEAYPQTIIKTDSPLPASNSNSKDATPF
ncbi:hypothetical protein O181_045904, partial [Austropuccinia psidii MF-1]|nr:hypothetical protein [Austropuccinia psidii MF-1]